MSVAENKASVRQYLEEVWNNKNLAAVDQFVAPDLIQHVRNVPPGREGSKAFFNSVRRRFLIVRLAAKNRTQLRAERERSAT
jgi:predicted SnoaL-like aldol condensation-catalyzing enzyme